MRWATKDDGHIVLARALKNHHFAKETGLLLPHIAFKEDGDGSDKSISVYNMNICPDIDTALLHADTYHRSLTIGFLFLNVSDCIDEDIVGVDVILDNDNTDIKKYHAGIKLSSVSEERTVQRGKLFLVSENNVWMR